MMKDQKSTRVIIVHGWADDPARGWMGWLTQELRASDVEVTAPRMPDPKQPNVDAWIEEVSKAVGTIDDHTILVGHSLGTYVLLRYLDAYTEPERAGKLILVAGFGGHERAQQGKQALPEVNFEGVKGRVEHIYSVYSDNDEIIPPAWSRELGVLLGAENVVDPGKGHFAGLHGCNTLPSVLNMIKA